MQQKIKKVFIGSSSEALYISNIIADALRKTNSPSKSYRIEPCVWDNASWKFNQANLTSLVEFPKLYDYAIFLFTPDDTVIVRDEPSKRVRDNVLFEFGLFVGQKDGTKKTFIIHPKGKNIVLASDIHGIYTPTYEHSKDHEILKNQLSQVVYKIAEAIDDFERFKMQLSEEAVKISLEHLRNKLSASDDEKKIVLIIEALKDLAEHKGNALNQSATDVLHDILSWTSALLDWVNPSELAKLQEHKLEQVTVYSSLPLEFNNGIGDLHKKFKITVVQNLLQGTKYNYYVDSQEVANQIIKFGKEYKNLINVYILDPFCITANFVCHHFDDGTFSAYQNIVRQGKLELLVKLDDFDALNLLQKLSFHKEKMKLKEVGGNKTYKK